MRTIIATFSRKNDKIQLQKITDTTTKMTWWRIVVQNKVVTLRTDYELEIKALWAFIEGVNDKLKDL